MPLIRKLDWRYRFAIWQAACGGVCRCPNAHVRPSSKRWLSNVDSQSPVLKAGVCGPHPCKAGTTSRPATSPDRRRSHPKLQPLHKAARCRQRADDLLTPGNGGRKAERNRRLGIAEFKKKTMKMGQSGRFYGQKGAKTKLARQLLLKPRDGRSRKAHLLNRTQVAKL